MISPFPKPLPHYPKFERLPQRKRMTAIAGFIYLDGVLMMADTEESFGETKSETDKLFRFPFKEGSRVGTVITGGAGDSATIEHANQQLLFFFREWNRKSKKAAKPNEIADTLNDFAHKYWRQELAPFRGFAYELVPAFEMLIAVNYNKNTSLFHWSRNKMYSVQQHTSIGAGVIQLHPMLRDTKFQATEETTLFMGLRMMFHAKRIVAGVSGSTVAMALRHSGETRIFGTDLTKKVEDLAVNFEQFLNNFVYTMVSNIASTINVEELETNVAHNLKAMPDMLKMYRDQYKEVMKQSSFGTSKG